MEEPTAPKILAADGTIEDPPLNREVFALVAGVSESPVEHIDESIFFYRDLKMDSVKAIELLCEVEDRFDIELDEAEMLPITTVGELIAVVVSAIRGNSLPLGPDP